MRILVIADPQIPVPPTYSWKFTLIRHLKRSSPAYNLNGFNLKRHRQGREPVYLATRF